MSSNKLKILIVDDSAFMRLLVSDLVSEGDEMEVVGTAVNGLEAFDQTKSLKPDVVLLDLHMAEYDGLYAVKEIMTKCPTPILILSSVGNTDLEPVFEALKNGAVDYMNKPNRNKSKIREIRSALINKIKSTARAKPNSIQLSSKKTTNIQSRRKKSKYDIIAIGASTGGPTAIERIISNLPADFDVPILICQHMPAAFIPPFVNRLKTLSSLDVIAATVNMRPIPGTIMFCPGHANLILKKEEGQVLIDFTDDKYPEYNNPSINAMMESVANIYKKKSVGIILTGMGKDGLNGMRAIKEAGGFTIAQNKESCVIYGMPKAAIQEKVVDVSLDIKEISGYLINDLQ